MSRRQKLFLLAVVIVGVGYAGLRFLTATKPIPDDFVNARMQGAVIAQNIVNLSNESASDLQKINEYDRAGNYTDALNLTIVLIKRSEDIRNQAVDLSAQVETMTKALSSINALEARQAALESISSRLALINRLINYSGYLGQLLETLRDRFTGKLPPDHQVETLVNQINAEVTAINSFNSQAGQAMDRFDKIVSK